MYRTRWTDPLRAIAWTVLSGLAAGCGTARPEADRPAESPAQAAARVLAAAEELEKEHKTRQAFAAYHQILRKYPDTPEGKTAAARVRQARQQSKARLGGRTHGKLPS